MRNSHLGEHSEIRKIVDSGSLSTSASVATAGTTLVIGFVLEFIFFLQTLLLAHF